MRRLTLTMILASILVVLGVQAAQATTIPPLTIPSGTEVIPHITFDSTNASYLKLYDPATGKDETIYSTEGSDSHVFEPQLSEDGKYVFFLDYHDFADFPDGSFVRQESISFVPSNGGVSTRIVTGGVGAINGYDLSRDGSKVMYWSQTLNEEGNYEDHLFTAPVESDATPTEVPLPSEHSQTGGILDPIFNEDGTGIFFTSGGQLYSMNLDGTGLTKLTDFSPVYDPDTGDLVSTPAGEDPQSKELSPDGNSIVYRGVLAMDSTQQYRTGIYTLPVSGGSSEEVAVPLSGESDMLNPHYNHDGSRIAFTQYGAEDPTTGGSTFNVYSVPVGGGDRKLLAEGFPQIVGNWGVVNYSASTAPTVTAVYPLDGAPNVSKNTHPTAEFDQDLDRATVNTNNVNLEMYNDLRQKWVPVSTNAPTYSESSKSITVNPTIALGSKKLYRVTLSTGIKSTTGEALASQYSWSFTTKK